jgi:hypothetical protein
MAFTKTFTLDETTIRKIKILAERFAGGNESALIRLLVQQAEIQEKLSMKPNNPVAESASKVEK